MMANRAGESKELLLSATRSNTLSSGRTPQITRSVPSRYSARRSSLFTSQSSARPSLAPGIYTSVTCKDTRPLRDKSFQSECMRNVSDYLAIARYPAPLTPKTFISPTAKEFQSIFRFLIVALIGPGLSWTKKFEDDALSILRDLRYPGLDSVSKTAFTAPGAPQSWPGMLAMLNWLVELCKAHDNWNNNDCISDPILMHPSQLAMDHPYLEDRLLWNFVSTTYDQWFDGGAEEFHEAESELKKMYDRASSATSEKVADLEAQVQKKMVELHQLHAQEPPLKRMEDEYIQLMSDKTKFIAFIELHRQKAEKTRQAIVKIKSAVSSQSDDLDQHRLELTQIELAVAAQNLAPDEVTRMNNERDSLHRGLDELRTRIAEASQSAYDHEMLVTKAMDRFESLHAEYIDLAHHIGLPPQLADITLSDTHGLGLDLNLDLGVEDLEALKLSGAVMRSSVWQDLQSRREAYRQDGLQLGNSSITLEDQYDRLQQQAERQKEEIMTLEVKLKMIHEQAEAGQAKLTAENANTNKVIVQLETEVANMLTASQQGVLVTQSQLESAKIAYKELRHRTAILQDSMVGQVGSHIDAIIRAKEHATNSLRSIRSMAESQ
ncbi:uncharacterized protein IL334_002000 [Kwoniella shivajii]|uniref:Kinetochore protein NDC80 n=1 Tax=Kwoniella shivajii TaxID=564305 RepID=A0ABZ1CTN8_9TREE|nr:hypothetical protein IL334_002000 [Kwoniella shivajii]